MSKRTSISNAIANKFKDINGTDIYLTNIFGNSYPYLKFWDEVNDFPCVYMTNGTELREYHPDGFKWGYLNITLKLYAKGEDSSMQLENLLADIETVIDNNRQVVYDAVNGYETTEIQILSITTDAGLLAPYAIGEMNLQVRYDV